MNRFIKVLMWLLAAMVLLSACSSGGGGGTAGGSSGGSGAAGGSYTVSGTVTGLTGSGLVLEDNGADDLSVTADGSFTFATAIANSGTYAVTVKTQPADETCTVNSGAGTVAGANVTDVTVTCSVNTYTVGGTVSGLSGSGLVLQDNSGDDLSVSANGAFTFATPVADGANYSVTVKAQPSGPTQTCTASSNTGTLAGTNVTTVAVVCSTNAYPVGGTISGLTGTLVLQNNGADDLTVNAAGSFTFATNVASGADYAVTVKTQPVGQTCSVSNGSGTVGGSNVTGVSVSCAANPTHTIGGSVTGMNALGLVLQDNGGDDLTITGNGSFTFATPISEGLGYNVTVKTQPPNQSCSVSSGNGTVSSGNVTNISVVCASTAFTVGGSVSGMSGGTLVLQDNGGDDLSITGNGTYTFATPVANGANYAVTIKTQPAGQTCSLTNPSGKIYSTNVTNVNVTCSAAAYTIGGTVSGLTGTLVLQTNGGDIDTITADGGFTFANTLANNSTYVVSVKVPQPSGELCSVSNGSGTVSGANVTNIAVTCVPSYTLEEDTSGLTGSLAISTLISNNIGGYNGISGPVAISQNGTFDHLGFTLVSGATYSIMINSQPVNQTCSVTNGAGTIGTANVVVPIDCATNAYTVGGTESGLGGGTLVLQNNGADDLTITNMFFTFATAIPVGGLYDVTVKTQPAGQLCSVSNGSGVMPASNVTNVAVTCSSSSFTVGGTASGVTGTVVLQDNGGDNLTITGNGGFTFATQVPNMAGYKVTALSGGAQYCTVTNGSGTVNSANVTNVAVSCTAVPQHFLYAAGTAYISTFPIDMTGGQLTSAPSSTAPCTVSYAGAFTPNAKFYYAATQSTNNLTAYSVNATTGALSSIASYSTGTNPRFVAVDPTGSYAYVANGTSNNISAYTIDGTTGALTEMAGSPFIADAGTNWIAIDPTGTYLYAVNFNAYNISEYSIGAGGVLTPLAGSPFKISAYWPSAITISPSGKFAYISDSGDSRLFVYNVASGALTTKIAGTPYTTLPSPSGAVFDPTGNYLYLSNYGGGYNSGIPGQLSAFSVNTSTGALTQLSGSPYSVGSTASTTVVDSTGRFVFVLNGYYPNNVAAFLRDTSTGLLTPVDGSPFTTGDASGTLSMGVAP